MSILTTSPGLALTSGITHSTLPFAGATVVSAGFVVSTGLVVVVSAAGFVVVVSAGFVVDVVTTSSPKIVILPGLMLASNSTPS